MKKFDMIIWDWNGTIVDDVGMNLSIVNEMLNEYGLSSITQEYYKSVFSFPIFDFYKQLGFDVCCSEVYENLIHSFNQKIREQMSHIPLHMGAKDCLTELYCKGQNQIIISGLNENDLIYQAKLLEIDSCFSSIIGSKTADAIDKKDNIIKIINQQDIAPESILVIGDTVSDWELASTCGCSCVLLAHGHQSSCILKKTSAPVFEGFTAELTSILIK